MGYDSITNPIASPAHNSFNVRPRLPLSEADAAMLAPPAHGKRLSFADLIDVINPLQHIPIVSTIYRRLTGDEMGAPARLAGGALFGGVIGLAAAVVDTVVDKVSGAGMGDHVMNAMLGKGRHDAPATAAVATAAGDVPYRGRVSINPMRGDAAATAVPPNPIVYANITAVAPNTLDPATFRALADTLGSAAPLAHLAPPEGGAKPQRDKRQGGPVAAASYDEALARMTRALDAYQVKKPDNAANPR